LIDSEGSASANLTTHRIAKKAGIAVGSLYQYFPNVEAVLYEIHRGFAERARQTFAEFDSAAYLTLPREEFFEKLFRAITSHSPEELEIVLAIRTETRVYNSLAEIEKEQAEYAACEIAKFMKYYGSTWPEERLLQLALYIYYMDWGNWLYRDHVKEKASEAQDWEEFVFKSLISKCFD